MFIDYLLEVITAAVVSGVLTAALIWLSKSWISERLKHAIKNEYEQKLATHKAELKAQSDVEIENLKSSLQITATEHNVRFSNLHEKRAEIIAETYSLLKTLCVKLADYVKIFEPIGDKPKDERQKLFADAHNKFRDYYPKRIIFLPKSTTDKVEKIDLQLVKAFNEFVFSVDLNKDNASVQKWNEIFERVNGEIWEALRELEDEFRGLLGDKS